MKNVLKTRTSFINKDRDNKLPITSNVLKNLTYDVQRCKQEAYSTGGVVQFSFGKDAPHATVPLTTRACASK